MAKLDWAKNEALRRMQRSGTEPAKVGSLSSGKNAKPGKKRAKRKGKAVAGGKATARQLKRPALQSAPPTLNASPSAELTPLWEELKRLENEVRELERQLYRKCTQHAELRANILKMIPPNQAIHPPKLIPAAKAADRLLRRRGLKGRKAK